MARGGKRGRPRLNRGSPEIICSPSPSTTGGEVIIQSINEEEVNPPQIINEPVTETGPNSARVSPSFASLVDPNEGTALQFLPASNVQGVMCAQLNPEDIAGEVAYWQNAVLCCVLGANPPFEVVKGYVHRIWNHLAIDKVLLIRKGLYLIRFHEQSDALLVAQKGVFYFDHKPFIVKAWTPEMEIKTDAITSLPIWVQLPDLDIKYWGMQSLSKIGSVLGLPLKTDKYTKEKTMLKYARIMIEMQLDGEFPEYIEFINERGVLIRQKVNYEWMPLKCDHCHMYGHLQESCRKKEARKEWRIKAPSSSTIQEPTANDPEVEENRDFQVASRHTTKQLTATRRDTPIVPLVTNNVYAILGEGTSNVAKVGPGEGLPPHG